MTRGPLRAYAVLLRAIGPVTHAVMPMQALCARCRDAGLEHVTSYLATGNLLVRTDLDAGEVRGRAQAVVAGFGLANSVFVRDLDQMRAVLDGNPFAQATQDHPSQVIVCFGTDSGGDFNWIADHAGPERIISSGKDLFVDYSGRISGAALAPGTIERRSKTPLTFRNWNTVSGIVKRLAAST